MKGETVDDRAIAREIAPCFVARGSRRTDVVVLACTHYPLLRDHFLRRAPWPVDYIDPAPAIARRVNQLLGVSRALQPEGRFSVAPAIFTSGAAPSEALAKALREFSLEAQDLGTIAIAAAQRLTPA